MTIENALKRIHWRASAGNQYKPNENDIQAVNEVVEWVQRQKEKTILEQQLFAKLYTVYFGELLLHFRDVNLAQTEIHKVIGDTMESHIYWFRERLNVISFDEAHTALGLDKRHPLLLSKEENEKESVILENNQEYFLKHVNKWTIDQVKASLENQITEAINKYK